MTQVSRITELGPYDLAEGVRFFPMFGEGAMLNVVDFDPGAVVAEHSHPHEQLGLVLSGEVRMTIDGIEHRLAPEDAYQIPGGVAHGATAGPEGCRVIDVFQPIREEYRALADKA